MLKTVSYNNIRPKVKSYKKDLCDKGYRTLYFKKNLFVKPFEYSPNNIEKWIVNDAKMVNGKQHLDVWLNPRYFPDNGGHTTLISNNVQEFTTSELSISL